MWDVGSVARLLGSLMLQEFGFETFNMGGGTRYRVYDSIDEER